MGLLVPPKCGGSGVTIQLKRYRLRGRAKRITIDLDPTDAETHGQQQLAMFNGFYREWCYLPTLGFLTFNNEPEQYAFAAVLRPGNAPTTAGAIGLLRRIIRSYARRSGEHSSAFAWTLASLRLKCTNSSNSTMSSTSSESVRTGSWGAASRSG